MKNIFIYFFSIILLFTSPLFSSDLFDFDHNYDPNIVELPKNVQDQYKQMGGVSALMWECFEDTEFEDLLFKSIGNVFFSNPEQGYEMFLLLKLYYDAGDIAFEHKVLWNGTLGEYNKKSFDCNSQSDLELIKSFNNNFINSLQ